MAFRYPLQSILRLRRSLERQEEQLLFVVASQANRLRAEIEDLDQSELARKWSALNEMAGGSFGSSLQFLAVCAEAMAERRKGIQIQLLAAEQRRAHQLAVYNLARQKREILESLREDQEFAYDLDTFRREQREADETFLLRTFFDQQQ
jgi:flagellar export protein FliJ